MVSHVPFTYLRFIIILSHFGSSIPFFYLFPFYLPSVRSRTTIFPLPVPRDSNRYQGILARNICITIGFNKAQTLSSNCSIIEHRRHPSQVSVCFFDSLFFLFLFFTLDISRITLKASSLRCGSCSSHPILVFFSNSTFHIHTLPYSVFMRTYAIICILALLYFNAPSLIFDIQIIICIYLHLTESKVQSSLFCIINTFEFTLFSLYIPFFPVGGANLRSSSY
ncbi:hypothetical protein C8Q75DRAFT_307756 [Abortiporus biennis]|nr:hypothetical protein C8Q75DRAFT_307756 [Abortiporus biennis]